ncbi:MAG: gliding motility-associated C-terminal domain-containing protein [Bacteroidia bacterium]
MRSGLVLVFCLFAGLLANAQPTFTMGNQTVTECRAFFEDSGNNTIAPGNYANNENYTFVILNPQATQIILSFQSFCTEMVMDVLRVFDGPDTNSVLLGAFSGTTLPPGLTATSGAMTIHFRSDANVTCTGWNAYWYSIVPPPIPPNLSQVSANCLSTFIDVQLDTSVHCDSVYASAFVLTGNPLRNVVAAQAINCLNDSTRSIRLTVDQAFNDCASYGLSWNLNLLDRCDSLYEFLLNANFSITDCPLSASLTASDDSICIGDCILLEATGIGGDCNYTYQWNQGLPATPGPHLICPPPGTTTYTVIVNDLSGNGPDTLSVSVLVTSPPDAGPDTLVCLQSPPFDLAPRANPPGGVFFGPGITAAAAGTFDPALAGQAQSYIYYSVNGCADSLLIELVDVDAGPTQGSCPGGLPMAMYGFNPVGGFWTGNNIDSSGIYSPPPAVLTDTVYYHFAGCVASKLIFVDSIVMNKFDTICQSSPPYQLQFQPLGGQWSGVALVDALLGIIDPQLTQPGDHVLYYDLNGCLDSLQLHIKAIDAGPGFITCPLNAPFNLPPANPPGGIWSGPGITDSLAGTFDPGVNGSGNSQLWLFYQLDGCVDSMQISLVRTNINPDTLRRCLANGTLGLGPGNTGRTPAGGVWSGPGVNPAGNGSFNPNTAGPGFHKLYYTANACTDSLVIEVQQVPQLQADTTVCVLTPPFVVQSNLTGGLWQGTGISNSSNGTFDPALAGVGQHWVYQTFSGLCADSVLITVEAVPNISMGGIDSLVCYRDTLYTLNLQPAAGNLWGAGVQGNTFNPVLAGVGRHWLYYTAGNGDCERTDSLLVEVGDSLSLQLMSSADTLCFGDELVLWAQLRGGGPGRNLVWLYDGSSSDSLRISPQQSAWYLVEATDGCSEPIVDSVYVFVHPDLVYQLVQTEINCFDSLGTFNVQFAAGMPYEVLWLINPPQASSQLQAPQGTYRVQITDTITQCSRIDTVQLTAFPPVSANFQPNPNRRGCHDLAEADITFIDLSTGGLSGYWDFGNGLTEPYVMGQYPRMLYTDTGRFVVQLVIENAAGCSDRTERVICVQVMPRILVPNAFTPNRDLTNDRFRIVAVGITDLEIVIYDRWGKAVFESRGIDFEWDGTSNGTPLPNGVYAYIIYYTDFTHGGRRMQSGSVKLIK